MTNFYEIENLLQCPICLNRFQTPKVLDCQHTFCLICLQSIYDTQNQTLTCPTCQRNIHLTQGLNELPNNLLLISLMDFEPVKAKCPCCQKIEILTICEHCKCTKCKNCNEKHVNDVRQLIKTTLEKLNNGDQDDLKVSIHNSFKSIRHQICNQFQIIRQKHDSNLLEKQIDVFKQLDAYEQNLLIRMKNDLRLLEQSKLEITKSNMKLNSKSEPELINLLTTASDIQSRLTEKLAEYHCSLNSIEISLQYNQDQIHQFHQMCHSFQLNINEKAEETILSFPSEPIYLTLRTFLNQEYKYCITLDKTIYELKELIGIQENLNPKRIILTKLDNHFDELINNRTLKSYNCDSTTIFMIRLRK